MGILVSVPSMFNVSLKWLVLILLSFLQQDIVPPGVVVSDLNLPKVFRIAMLTKAIMLIK